MKQKMTNKTQKAQLNNLQTQNQINLKVDAYLLKRTISEINKNLRQNQKNSSLLNHRAIIHHQTGQNQQTIKDLNLAIESNHLNFMAYFNLFSMYIQNGNQQQAFDQLCCSLSCLYLIRAKGQRRQLDAQKSIIYANNNIQAHILKCLMFMQKKDKTNLKLALDQMNITLEILSQYKHIDKCKKFNGLRDLIIQDMQKKELYQTIIHIKNNQSLKNTSKSDKTRYNLNQNQKCNHRLINSYKQQQSLKEQIHERLVEFNQVFQQLINNKEFQIVSKIETKNPFKKLNNFILELQKTEPRSSQLAAFKASNISQNQQFSTIQINTKTVNPQNNQQSQLAKLFQNDYVKEGFQSQHQKKQVASSNYMLTESKKDQLLQIANSQPLLLQAYESNINSEERDKFTTSQQNDNKIEEFKEKETDKQRKISSEEFINIQNMHIKDINTLKNSQNNKRQIPNIKSYLDLSAKSSIDSLMCQSNEVIHFYKDIEKVGKRKKLQFKIQNFMKTDNFSSNKKSKKYLYCLGQYNYQNKEKNQFKTSCQKLQEGCCLWDQIYPPVKMTKNPQFFKIHVYSKNYFAQFDEFVGSGQKQMTTTGQNQIQIVNPNLQIVGILSIKVYLI